MGKKKGKNTFQKVVAWIHLWPSLVAGIIVLFVCLTGTIIVYVDEIMAFTGGEALYVQPGETRITQDYIFEEVKRIDPNYHISEIVFYQQENRSIRLRVFDTVKRDLFIMYINPYTGELLKTDHTIYFFYIIAHLHAQLLAGPVGGWIVVISTLIFLIGCITGLILWWPKKWTRTTRKASFTIKWQAGFKRLNYDLHNVLGFYSLPLSIVLSLSGLLIFFHPLMDATVKLAGGSQGGLQEEMIQADSCLVSQDMVKLAYKTLNESFPEKEAVNIWVYNQHKMGTFTFNSGTPGLKSVENADYTVYNRYTGEKLDIDKKRIIHEKTENIVWQLHMGQWWGPFGKLLTFLTGLIATSLSVTGFIIWWERYKKKKKRKVSLLK